MSVIKTKKDELDNVIRELRANEVRNFSELRENQESNNYDWLRFYTAGEDLIKNAVAKYNLQKYRELSSSGSFEFSELAKQAAKQRKKEELAKVQRLRDGKCNYIDANGKIISDTWFDWIGDFYDELALVQRERENHEYNYIDKEGKIISEQWFKWLDYFHNGFARVQSFDDEFNFIDRQGKLLSNEWFRYVDYFDEYDRAVVERTNGELCKIDKNGKIVSE